MVTLKTIILRNPPYLRLWSTSLCTYLFVGFADMHTEHQHVTLLLLTFCISSWERSCLFLINLCTLQKMVQRGTQFGKRCFYSATAVHHFHFKIWMQNPCKHIPHAQLANTPGCMKNDASQIQETVNTCVTEASAWYISQELNLLMVIIWTAVDRTYVFGSNDLKIHSWSLAIKQWDISPLHTHARRGSPSNII
jgi:hypothetical protein